MKDRNICTNKKIFFIFIFVCLLILQTAYIKNSEQLVGVYMITAYEKTTKTNERLSNAFCGQHHQLIHQI
jgi:Na+-transporting methylmalonyl-CoA/oxaloacetate decarboxylase beta subunit